MACGNLFINLNAGLGVSVDALHDEDFIIVSGLDPDLQIPDAEIAPDAKGKYIISIAGYGLVHHRGVPIPDAIEIRAELIEERSRQKRLNILNKDSITVDWDYSPELYFYFV